MRGIPSDGRPDPRGYLARTTGGAGLRRTDGRVRRGYLARTTDCAERHLSRRHKRGFGSATRSTGGSRRRSRLATTWRGLREALRGTFICRGEASSLLKRTPPTAGSINFRRERGIAATSLANRAPHTPEVAAGCRGSIECAGANCRIWCPRARAFLRTNFCHPFDRATTNVGHRRRMSDRTGMGTPMGARTNLVSLRERLDKLGRDTRAHGHARSDRFDRAWANPISTSCAIGQIWSVPGNARTNLVGTHERLDKSEPHTHARPDRFGQCHAQPHVRSDRFSRDRKRPDKSKLHTHARK